MSEKQKWIRHGKSYDWTPPKQATAWKRLPVIRWFRYVYLSVMAERHYGVWGVASIRTGYDDWCLYGVFHGYI